MDPHEWQKYFLQLEIYQFELGMNENQKQFRLIQSFDLNQLNDKDQIFLNYIEVLDTILVIQENVKILFRIIKLIWSN